MKTNMHPTKLSLVAASIFALNGCIEVDDNSNNELTAAVQQQNQILTDQLNQSQQTNTVTMVGLVVDAFDGSTINDAQITVKTVTETVAENLTITDGSFNIEGLPANSTIEIVISSANDSFLTRAFYRNTGDATSGVAEKDFGEFEVSEGEEFSIIINDSLTNMPVTGLEFTASSVIGSGSNSEEFDHISTFDEVNGLYKIILPKFIPLNVFAQLDNDRDGRLDYVVENFFGISGTRLFIRQTELADLEPILLAELTEPENNIREIEFRLSIVDRAGEVIEGAMVALEDELNDIEATFDADSGQYVLNASFLYSSQLQIPAFSIGDINYSSSAVSVYLNSDNDEVLNISISGGSGNSFYQVLDGDVVSFVLQPRVISQPQTDLETIVVSDPEESPTNELNVFYSQEISVVNESITLRNFDAVTVVRGNDSPTDTVLDGTTRLTSGVDVPVTSSLSLNGTKLTVAPAEALQPGQNHRYTIGAVTIVSSELSVNLSSEDNVDFNSANPVSATPFDISNVRLDNNNYTTNGSAILAQNTAGVTASVSDNRNGVYAFFPAEINQLQQFTLNQISYVSDNVSRDDFRSYEVVRNGEIRVGTQNLVSVASNENVQSSGVYGTFFGTALPDSFGVYRLGSLEYLSDNTLTQANSITFEYAYETKAGEISTGLITLPVE